MDVLLEIGGLAINIEILNKGYERLLLFDEHLGFYYFLGFKWHVGFFPPAPPSFEMIYALLVAWLLIKGLHVKHMLKL